MKNQIKFLTYFVGLICVISSTNSILAFIEKTDKATDQGQKCNFELYNKADKPLFFTLKDSSGNIIFNNEPVKNGGKIRTIVDNPNGSFIMKIWYNNAPIRQTADIEKAITAPQKERTTLFFTFDKKGDLRPQTGTLMGLGGKTDSGIKLDKSKNVKSENIEYLFSG